MRPRPSGIRGHRAGRHLVLAALVVCWLVASGSASVAGTHQCKCATACRGATCCCAADDPAPSARRAATPPVLPLARVAGLAVGCAPCGGDGLPGPSPGSNAVKLAALGLAMPLTPPTLGPYLTSTSTRIHSFTSSPRLDDPPEARVFA